MKSGYNRQGQYQRLQYESLHDLCFLYGRYGYREFGCPLKTKETKPSDPETPKSSSKAGEESSMEFQNKSNNLSFIEWTIVQGSCWCPTKASRCNLGKASKNPVGKLGRDNQGESLKRSATDFAGANRGIFYQSSARSCIHSGSRFSTLGNQEVHEDLKADMVGTRSNEIIEDEIEDDTLAMSNARRDKGKGVITKEESVTDEVNLRVSHPHLTAEIRPIIAEGKLMRINLSQGNSKWPKEKALKEVMNCLELGPIKLKPNRAAVERWVTIRRGKCANKSI